MAAAAAVLAEHGAPSDAANLDLYKHIVSSVLAMSKDEQSKEGELSCQEFLWQLIQPLQATLSGSDPVGKVFCSAAPTSLTLVYIMQAAWARHAGAACEPACSYD